VKRTPTDPRAQAKRSALNALRRARRAAVRSGVDLTDWEGEFLGSVEQRVETFGRAFADPEKGAPGHALSGRQGVKLKEIAAKAHGKPPRALQRKLPRKPFGRKPKPDKR
jgi:hypothetical protein